MVPPAQHALVRSSGSARQLLTWFSPLPWREVPSTSASKSTLRPLTASHCGAKPWSDMENTVVSSSPMSELPRAKVASASSYAASMYPSRSTIRPSGTSSFSTSSKNGLGSPSMSVSVTRPMNWWLNSSVTGVPSISRSASTPKVVKMYSR